MEKFVIYDENGDVTNKDAVAKAISAFRSRVSRGLIEASVRGKVRNAFAAAPATGNKGGFTPSIKADTPTRVP